MIRIKDLVINSWSVDFFYASTDHLNSIWKIVFDLGPNKNRQIAKFDSEMERDRAFNMLCNQFVDIDVS